MNDVIELLDSIATQMSGKNIFIGEVVADDFVKDYQAIPAEAAKRQSLDEHEVEAIRAEGLRLAAEGTDGWFANELMDVFVTNLLLDRAEQNPAVARDVFGEETAQKFEQAEWQRQQGNTAMADKITASARTEAPVARVCTGGSCGLEAVNSLSSEGKDLAKKTRAEVGDTILKDKDRSCKCGKKGSIVYAFNKTKVNKYCTNCHAFESKTTGVSKKT